MFLKPCSSPKLNVNTFNSLFFLSPPNSTLLWFLKGGKKKCQKTASLVGMTSSCSFFVLPLHLLAPSAFTRLGCWGRTCLVLSAVRWQTQGSESIWRICCNAVILVWRGKAILLKTLHVQYDTVTGVFWWNPATSWLGNSSCASFLSFPSTFCYALQVTQLYGLIHLRISNLAFQTEIHRHELQLDMKNVGRLTGFLCFKGTGDSSELWKFSSKKMFVRSPCLQLQIALSSADGRW